MNCEHTQNINMKKANNLFDDFVIYWCFWKVMTVKLEIKQYTWNNCIQTQT